MEKRTRTIIILTTAIILVIAATLLILSDREWIFDQTGDTVATVTRFVPDVTVKNISLEMVEEVGRPLISGDTLDTNNRGFALVMFLDESVTRVRPESQLIIRSNLNADKTMNVQTVIDLMFGSFLMDVVNRGDTEFQIRTSQTVTTVKGTKFGATDENFLWVEDGEVEVQSLVSGARVTLQEMSFVQLDETGSLETGELTEEMLEELNSEFAILDGDLIERQLRLQFRNNRGEPVDEDLRIYERDES